MCYGGCDCQRCSGEPPVLKSDRQLCSDDWKDLTSAKEKSITVYKIQNPEGLFSTGGSTPDWKRQGKTWVALNHLNAHLTMIHDDVHWRRVPGDPYSGCIVIEYRSTPVKKSRIIEGRMT